MPMKTRDAISTSGIYLRIRSDFSFLSKFIFYSLMEKAIELSALFFLRKYR